MKSSKNSSSGHCIIVAPDDLTHLEDFLKKHFATLIYRITCEDGTALEPTCLQDILDYENPTFRRIATLVIEASASGDHLAADRITISLGKVATFLGGTQSISLRFADVSAQKPIEEELLLRLRQMRPWYSLLSKVPFTFLLPTASVAFSFVLNAASVVHKLRSSVVVPDPPSRFSDSEAQVMMLGFIISLFLVGYVLDRFRDYLFPRYFFLLGRQKREYEQRRTVSYTIFGVIVLGILINIASTIIYR